MVIIKPTPVKNCLRRRTCDMLREIWWPYWHMMMFLRFRTLINVRLQLYLASTLTEGNNRRWGLQYTPKCCNSFSVWCH